MDEYQILNFSEAFQLWNLSIKHKAEEIIAQSKSETQGIIEICEAESAASRERFEAERAADRLLTAKPSPSEDEQQRIRRELAEKTRALAERVESVRQGVAVKLQAAKRQNELTKRATVKARLMDPKNTTAANTSASRPPTRYYAIVGRGTAAIVNHTTLRQTTAGQDRLKDPKKSTEKLPVMHIGLTDPWYLYHAHGMGQPRQLLILPGHHYRPSCLDRTIRSGMHSWDFAFKNLQEWALLKMKYGFEHLEGWVALVQKKSEESTDWTSPDLWNEKMITDADLLSKLKTEWKTAFAADAAYRLLVVLPDASVVSIYAEKVDICTGVARSAVRPDKPHKDLAGAMGEARPRLWEPPESWTEELKNRKVLTGPEALFMITPWNAAHRIYVNGAGGIGLNMIERAEDEGSTMDWQHYQLLHTNSFGLPRNDTVLKNRRTGKPCEPGDSGLRNADATMKAEPALLSEGLFNLYPADPKWRFGSKATLDYDAVQISGSKLKVPIKVNADAKIHDHFEKEATGATGTFPLSAEFMKANAAISEDDGRDGKYDRLLCCTGQTAGSLGTPQCMAGDGRFTFSVVDMNGTTVALQADGGAVRILGGALTNHATFPGLIANSPTSATKEYFYTLPLSAVAPGFIFSGVNIATANGWFDDKPNTNANTANRDQIKNDLVNKGVAADLADAVARAVVNKRRVVNGFAYYSEVWDALGTDADLVKKDGWHSAAFKLDLTYREAGKFLD